MKYLLYDHWGGRLHDAKKTVSNTEDDLMCWASAASNVLAWTKWGFPPAHNFDSEDTVFRYFQTHWKDTNGYPQKAWEWWFNGVNDANVDVPGGGFWNGSPYVFNNYYHVEGDRTQALSAIDNFLHHGYGVVLELISQHGGHYITCWGYEYDEKNNYIGIFITDSDDYLCGQPRYYQLSQTGWSYPGWWYFQYYNTSTQFLISTVHALDRFPSPSPPSNLEII